MPSTSVGISESEKQGEICNHNWFSVSMAYLEKHHTATEFNQLLDLIRHFASKLAFSECALFSCDRLIDVVAFTLSSRCSAFLSRNTWDQQFAQYGIAATCGAIRDPQNQWELQSTVQERILKPLVSAIYLKSHTSNLSVTHMYQDYKQRFVQCQHHRNAKTNSAQLFSGCCFRDRVRTVVNSFSFTLSCDPLFVTERRWYNVPSRNDESLVGKFVHVASALACLLDICNDPEAKKCCCNNNREVSHDSPLSSRKTPRHRRGKRIKCKKLSHRSKKQMKIDSSDSTDSSRYSTDNQASRNNPMFRDQNLGVQTPPLFTVKPIHELPTTHTSSSGGEKVQNGQRQARTRPDAGDLPRPPPSMFVTSFRPRFRSNSDDFEQLNKQLELFHRVAVGRRNAKKIMQRTSWLHRRRYGKQPKIVATRRIVSLDPSPKEQCSGRLVEEFNTNSHFINSLIQPEESLPLQTKPFESSLPLPKIVTFGDDAVENPTINYNSDDNDSSSNNPDAIRECTDNQSGYSDAGEAESGTEFVLPAATYGSESENNAPNDIVITPGENSVALCNINRVPIELASVMTQTDVSLLEISPPLPLPPTPDEEIMQIEETPHVWDTSVVSNITEIQQPEHAHKYRVVTAKLADYFSQATLSFHDGARHFLLLLTSFNDQNSSGRRVGDLLQLLGAMPGITDRLHEVFNHEKSLHNRASQEMALLSESTSQQAAQVLAAFKKEKHDHETARREIMALLESNRQLTEANSALQEKFEQQIDISANKESDSADKMEAFEQQIRTFTNQKLAMELQISSLSQAADAAILARDTILTTAHQAEHTTAVNSLCAKYEQDRKDTKTDYDNRILVLQNDNNTLGIQVSDVKRLNADLQRDLLTEQTRIGSLETEIDKLTSRLELKESECTLGVEAIERQTKASDHTIEELRLKLDNTGKELVITNENISALKKENSNLKSQAASQKAAYSRVEADLAALNTERNMMTTRLEQADLFMEEQHALVRSMKDENLRLQSDIHTFRNAARMSRKTVRLSDDEPPANKKVLMAYVAPQASDSQRSSDILPATSPDGVGATGLPNLELPQGHTAVKLWETQRIRHTIRHRSSPDSVPISSHRLYNQITEEAKLYETELKQQYATMNQDKASPFQTSNVSPHVATAKKATVGSGGKATAAKKGLDEKEGIKSKSREWTERLSLESYKPAKKVTGPITPSNYVVHESEKPLRPKLKPYVTKRPRNVNRVKPLLTKAIPLEMPPVKFSLAPPSFTISKNPFENASPAEQSEMAVEEVEDKSADYVDGVKVSVYDQSCSTQYDSTMESTNDNAHCVAEMYPDPADVINGMNSKSHDQHLSTIDDNIDLDFPVL